MKNILPFILFIVVLVSACDNQSDMILSASKMEDVLYDYHLAQGLIDQLPSNEREDKAQDYINAVFVKHGVTEAQFDSSIVYYNRNNRELYKIYDNLEKRYVSKNEELQLMNGNNDMMAVFANGGDTTNIWNASKVLVLRNKSIINKESFTIYADTSFHNKDQFILSFSNNFFNQSNENNNTRLSVGLSVLYKNGKSTAQTRLISFNGRQQMTVSASEESEISQIIGFFYYQGKAQERNLCVLSDISLIRMHSKEEPKVEQASDSLKTDTLPTDTASGKGNKRYTPEELRLINKSDEQIKIETAPSVRRPNSIGPRRKTVH